MRNYGATDLVVTVSQSQLKVNKKQKLLAFIDKYTDMDAAFSVGTDRDYIILRIKGLAFRMIVLFAKTGMAAFFWEATSDLITLNPDEFVTDSGLFVGYSAFTGIGAGIGVDIGMFA